VLVNIALAYTSEISLQGYEYALTIYNIYKAAVFLGLGSNGGVRHAYIDTAITLLSKKLYGVVRAKVYESKAVGYKNQRNFLNTVVRGTTILTCTDLLSYAKELEQQIGGTYRFRWGPCEVDIDILFYSDLIYRDGRLTIPHPMVNERDFVLKPMTDIAPEFVHPVYLKTMRCL